MVAAVGCGILFSPLIRSGITHRTVGNLKNAVQLTGLFIGTAYGVCNFIAQFRLLNRLLISKPLSYHFIYPGNSPEPGTGDKMKPENFGGGVVTMQYLQAKEAYKDKSS